MSTLLRFCLRPRRIVLSLVPVVLALLMTGCGGGGSIAQLIYQTDWTNRGQNITGLSQRVRVFDDQERLLRSVTVNQDSDGLQQVNINDIGTGMKHLMVELFSGRDLGGTKTGQLDAWVNIDGSVTFLSGVGDQLSQVKVSPAAATLQVDRTMRFYAAGYGSNTRATFVAPNTFTWQTFGGVATVDSTGLVQATATGDGTVRATHTPSGLQGGAALHVDPFQAVTSEWTVMVFMNAANDLSQFSILNMNQIEMVADMPANVRFVVQWKQSPSWLPNQFVGTRRYLAKPNVNSNINSELIQDMGTNVDMGDPATLNQFVAWTKTHYPANRYVLVIWNHGNGWLNRPDQRLDPTRGVSYDDETGNFIHTNDLAAAIGSLVDVVAWDASLMQMIEVAYEIKDQARFVVGSEESPPGEGYPYHLIFDDFRDRPLDSTASLTEAFVTGMLSVPAYANRKITQSSIDTAQLEPLVQAIDALAVQLIANRNAIAPQIPAIRAATQAYSESAALNRHFRDLYHLCLNLESTLTGFPTIQAAAANVRTAITAAVIHEGHNAQSPNSHGVSIDFSDSAEFAVNAADYALLRFATATQWNEWLAQAP